MLRHVMKVIIVTAVVVAAYLLYRTLQQYTWDQVSTALGTIPRTNLVLGLLFAAASYFCLSCFDALAVRYVGKPLPFHQTALASFVSLSIGHNVGVAALSSAAVRYRYYARWGLSAADVALVVVFCGVTVALGLMTLGAVALFLRPQDATAMTGLGPATIKAVATVAALLPLIYLALSHFAQQTIRFRRWSFRLPTLGIAVGQVVVGTVNFAVVAACLYQMLSAFPEANYLKVASVSIIANVAAIIAHVPGGIGVLEATVVHILPGAGSVAAVIAFRVIYYFIPLAIGLPLLGASEFVAKNGTKRDDLSGKQPQET